MLYEIRVRTNKRNGDDLGLTLAQVVDFNLRTNCVSMHYCSRLGRYDAGEVKKVAIGITRTDVRKIYRLIDVLMVEAYFDIASFLNLENRLAAKRQVLELVHSVMLDSAARFSWSVEPVERSYESLRDSDLEYSYTYGNAKSSPDRQYKAQLKLLYQEKHAVIGSS